MIEAEAAETKTEARCPAAHEFIRSWVCELFSNLSKLYPEANALAPSHDAETTFSSTCRPSKQTANDGILQDDYDLTDPKEFARFLEVADIGLIRLECSPQLWLVQGDCSVVAWADSVI